MNMNIIKSNVKPNLSNNEKRRYQMSAEHFMRGASDFYAEHYGQIKRIIDVDLIKHKLEQSYNEVISDFKSKLKEKADNLKEQAQSGLSRFIDFILDGSIV